MSVDQNNAVFVVYDPPRSDLPYLAVVLMPGKDDPLVTACNTEAEAEAFSQRMALEFAGLPKDQ
ncbi:MAG: hypothetical protein GJU76_02770 [Gallionella sp.]|jgi:hypothetical protein|nr:hypothetical protein [Gallionella sp.]